MPVVTPNLESAHDAPEQARESLLTAGTLVGGRYRVEAFVARGGMGEIYRATHQGLGLTVALKVMATAMAPHPEAVTRFKREGMAAAKLRHDNIVQVHDVGEHEGRGYLAMEWLDGEDLGAYLEREGAMPVHRMIELLQPMVLAIANAHACGVVHRDLKPANLFLARQSDGTLRLKVVDFGIARIVDASDPQHTRSETLLGTPSYMAPELCAGRAKASETTDVYALGAILYECATGRRAFDGRNPLEILRRVCDAVPQPVRAVNPAVPEALAAVIARAMAVSPEARFMSATALADALIPFASETTRPRGALRRSPSIPQHSNSIPPSDVDLSRPPRERDRRPLWIISGSAALTIALVVLGALTRSAPVAPPTARPLSSPPRAVAPVAPLAPALALPADPPPALPAPLAPAVFAPPPASARAPRVVVRRVAPVARVAPPVVPPSQPAAPPDERSSNGARILE